MTVLTPTTWKKFPETTVTAIIWPSTRKSMSGSAAYASVKT